MGLRSIRPAYLVPCKYQMGREELFGEGGATTALNKLEVNQSESTSAVTAWCGKWSGYDFLPPWVLCDPPLHTFLPVGLPMCSGPCPRMRSMQVSAGAATRVALGEGGVCLLPLGKALPLAMAFLDSLTAIPLVDN